MKRLSQVLFFLLLLFLPTQLGLHFWPDSALILGRRIDYLSPTFYIFDFIFIGWFITAIIIYRSKIKLDSVILETQSEVWRTPESDSGKMGMTVYKHLRRLNLPFLGFLFISLITLWQHGWSVVGAYFVLRLWQAIGLIWLIRTIKPQLKQVLLPLMFGAIFIGLLTGGQFIKQGSINGLFYFLGERSFSNLTAGIARITVSGRLILRPYATFSHPNVLAGYLTFILALFLYAPKTQLIRSKQLDYFLKRAGLAATLLGIGLSFSRASWLVAAGLIIIRVWQQKKELGKAVIGLMLVGIIVEELFLGRIISNLLLYPEPLRQRLDLLDSAWTIFLNSPIWGVGLGNFIPLLAKTGLAYTLLQPVHSIYLLWLAETGIIGAGLLAYFVFKLFYTGLNKKNKLLFAVLCGGFVLGAFDHYLLTQPQTRNLWLVLLAALSV